MKELSLTEQREWLTIRERIKGNVGFVWAVFEDLRRIRDARLYRAEFGTFEEYVRSDLGYTAKYAHRMIQALEVKHTVEAVGGVVATQIENERQLRELVGIEEDKLPKVLEAAAEIAGPERVTSTHLKQARESIAPREAKVRGSVVNDEAGSEVPDHLRRAHANGMLLKQVSTKVQGIAKELQKLAELPGGECLEVDKLAAQLSAVGNAVALSAYGATCDRCGGDGCDSCRERGWFPRRNVRD